MTNRVIKIHGGFRVGDEVEVRSPVSRLWRGTYVIVDFELMRAKIYSKANENIKSYPSSTWWVPLTDVRHAKFVREKA